ncbi:hypothetical protein GQX74_005248, partial [Glossina fuscipes]
MKKNNGSISLADRYILTLTSDRVRFIEAGHASVIGELQRLTPREKLKDWFGEPIAAPPEIGAKFKRDSSPHKNLLKVTTDLIDFDLTTRSSLTNLSFMLLVFAKQSLKFDTNSQKKTIGRTEGQISNAWRIKLGRKGSMRTESSDVWMY